MEYQYLPKGESRPRDDGDVVAISVFGDSGFVMIPTVGDYVSIDNSTGARSSFSGKVRSRLFNYVGAGSVMSCHVNIVVEETDDDWGRLVKE